MNGVPLPLNAVYYTITLTAHDKDGIALARYQLSPEASAVIKNYMQSEAGSIAINAATGIDKEPGT